MFGNLTIRPITHASFLMTYQGKTIYVDPDSPTSLYTGLPQADYILITHDHGDHFDTAAINAVAIRTRAPRKIVAPQAVFNAMSAAMRDLTTVIDYNAGTASTEQHRSARRDDALTVQREGRAGVQHQPSIRQGQRLHRHDRPEADLHQRRHRIAHGRELAALEDIDMAFVCMNTPFTMTPAEAASLVRDMIEPKVVYPVSLPKSDGNLGNSITFKNLMSTDFSIEVRLRKWY